jgi:hypothetical protein
MTYVLPVTAIVLALIAITMSLYVLRQLRLRARALSDSERRKHVLAAWNSDDGQYD